MKRLTLFGPPGTGKTTSIIRRVARDMKTVNPKQIAFSSFTTQASREGALRAQKKFNLGRKSFPHFMTIHAMCFRDLQLSRSEIVREEHISQLSKTLGVDLTFTGVCRKYYDAVVTKQSNPLAGRILMQELDWKLCQTVEAYYNEMKKQLELFDFNDLLTRYLENGAPLDIKEAYIDETQDLTPLQWKVAMKLFSRARRITAAGDDDQSIYGWNGADVKSFLNFSKKHIVLSNSYRLSKAVFDVSQRILEFIYDRKAKVFKPTRAKGQALIADLDEWTPHGDELCLARTKLGLERFVRYLRSRGKPYIKQSIPSYSISVYNACKAYEGWQKKTSPFSELRKYESMFNNFVINSTWQKQLLGEHDIPYYEMLMANKKFDPKAGHIRLETFHSCKGTEARRVLVNTDITRAVQQNLDSALPQQRFEELRCLYVACTRARTQLTILTPTKPLHYEGGYFYNGGYDAA